uniref:superoxide dismutase n=1 Tax=Desulfobacca acetoxidans TaxID=60893 RepID=A0A7C3WG79_9BACT
MAGSVALVLALACGQGQTGSKPYEIQDFSKLKGMPGFSDKALELHLSLYQGYVANANRLMEQLQQLAAQNQMGSPLYAELKRRLGWELNGMRLHELYFGNLGGKEPLKKDSKLMKRLEENFGSYDNWAADFKATGAMRGIGWVVLYEDPVTGRLFNAWINEHDVGHLAGANPLLILDVFEHAYLPDYGLKRGDYLQAFFQNINWPAVEARLAK